jgi:hypothetical protein
MNNREYFIAGIKACLAYLFFGLLYIFGEPYIHAEFWRNLSPIVRFIVFLFILLVPSSPFTKDFRKEMERRANT